MQVKRSTELSRLRALLELRDQESRKNLLKMQDSVNLLEAKAKDKQVRIDRFVASLSELNESRLQVTSITVELLQEESARRRMVENDLRKERLCLEAASNELRGALDELRQARKSWRQCHVRLNAIAQLKEKQKSDIKLQTELTLERELNDIAYGRFGDRDAIGQSSRLWGVK